MLTIRRADERGFADHGWLQARHTFSFADYRDEEHMSFRALRVLNEDRIAPATGFGMHPHRDMEIVTWLLAGELEHRDSLGNGGVLRPGDVQVMSAGVGVTHSERNPSPAAGTHLLQIWLLPSRSGVVPAYDQRRLDDADLRNRWGVLAAPADRVPAPGDLALPIHQDARVLASRLDAGRDLDLNLAPGRHGWLQVARGTLTVNGTALGAGDGVAATDETTLSISAATAAEVLAFDLA